MFTAQCVLGLIVLYVGCTHSWDMAISVGDRLDFYTNDTKTDTVRLDSHDLGALAYDEVHDILLYVDKQRNNDAICGYGISSKLNQCFTKRNGRNIHSIFYDTATEILYFSDTNERSINWISISFKSNIQENLLIEMDHGIPTDVVVDSLL
ncbi:hypothetical protein PYW07_010816 [Mythimna separata]|uniref:Uncharacterized protein n=1 Tax=Mythimna separata TaxID=271217 RepID=A0AAD8DLA3_MYTSE|nr:hypothetical protein PYW07_010816 [Mythimna separata]